MPLIADKVAYCTDRTVHGLNMRKPVHNSRCKVVVVVPNAVAVGEVRDFSLLFLPVVVESDRGQ
jgi:hypothetical protein